jgi:acetoin utilization deacetylase AcuC-like enzyme
MILYDTADRMGFFEFGIQIPILESKVTRTYEALVQDPALGPRVADWHIDRINENLVKKDLQRVHSGEYVDHLFSDRLEKEIIRTYELIDDQGRYYRYNPEEASLPLPRLFDRILQRVAGSTRCCRVALETGFCFYFGGGMHHAQYDYGNGFCLLNDIVIGLRKLQAEKRLRTAWVIDVDAHKGDGTAALTHGDDTIRTLSVHMARGWPLDGAPVDADGRPNPSFTPSDIDIPIAPGEEPTYNDRLLEGLQQLDALSQPDLAVIVSGADPYEKDALPSTQALRLTLSQMLARDQLIYHFLGERRIPYAGLMSGGYGPDVWEVYARFLLWALRDRLLSDGQEL